MECTICHKEVKPTKNKIYQLKATGRVYCSKECSNKYRGQISSIVMAKTNRLYASERMKRHNPMADPVSKEKMINTLKASGHKPLYRGGNGKLTKQQTALSSALNLPTEYAISTGKVMDSPNSYKVDIAYPELKIAIEIDGHSHCKQRSKLQDRKKEEVLGLLGWKVLRFWNAEVDADLNACAEKVKALIEQRR